MTTQQEKEAVDSLKEIARQLRLLNAALHQVVQKLK